MKNTSSILTFFCGINAAFQKIIKSRIILAGIYLGLIPLFALIYTILPNGFYHSYAKHEPIYRDAAENLRAELTDIYREDIRKIWFGGEIKTHSNDIEISSLEVTEDGQIKMRFIIIWQTVSIAGGYLKKLVVFDVIGQRESGVTIGDKMGLSLKTVNPADAVCPEGSEKFFGDVAKSHPGYLRQQFETLLVSKDVYNRWRSLCNAHEGFPDHVSGHFSRMLYLSAITIATVGYGDIVPVTNAARICTGLEAVLGVIVIGLFINAIGASPTTQAPLNREN